MTRTCALSRWVQIVHSHFPSRTDGGPQPMLCARYGTFLFRIIQSDPSPKAAAVQTLLAMPRWRPVAFGRLQSPELATKRTRALYQDKGYSDDWIEKRMRSIAIRDELTDEWKKRGFKEQPNTPSSPRKFPKPLRPDADSIRRVQVPQTREPPRPHERLGTHLLHARRSRSLLNITRTRDCAGLFRNKQAAREGGTVGRQRPPRTLSTKAGAKFASPS